MGMTREERETIIRFDEMGDAELYTASPMIYRRMVKRGFLPQELDNESWTFQLARKDVKLPSKRAKLSEERRRSLAESGKLALNKLRSKTPHLDVDKKTKN